MCPTHRPMTASSLSPSRCVCACDAACMHLPHDSCIFGSHSAQILPTPVYAARRMHGLCTHLPSLLACLPVVACLHLQPVWWCRQVVQMPVAVIVATCVATGVACWPSCSDSKAATIASSLMRATMSGASGVQSDCVCAQPCRVTLAQ